MKTLSFSRWMVKTRWKRTIKRIPSLSKWWKDVSLGNRLALPCALTLITWVTPRDFTTLSRTTILTRAVPTLPCLTSKWNFVPIRTIPTSKHCRLGYTRLLNNSLLRNNTKTPLKWWIKLYLITSLSLMTLSRKRISIRQGCWLTHILALYRMLFGISTWEWARRKWNLLKDEQIFLSWRSFVFEDISLTMLNE